MKPSEILSKAADLIEPEGAWTQQAYARDKCGQDVPSRASSACCWCIAGSINRTCWEAGTDSGSAHQHLYRIIQTGAPMSWNDAPGRTQPEVVAALRKAAELAREAGQ